MTTINSGNNSNNYQRNSEKFDLDFYFNHFNTSPVGSLSTRLLREGHHALIGISPFNSYFSFEKIKLLIKWARQNFDNFTIFYPDTISAHTLAAIDRSEDDVKRKVKKTDRDMINRIKRALSELNYDDSEIQKIFVTFTQIQNIPRYIELLDSFNNKFKSDPEVRNLCLGLAQEVIKNNTDNDKIDEDKLIEASNYVIKECAFLVDVPAIFNVTSSVIVYHDITIFSVIQRMSFLFNMEKINQGMVMLSITNIKNKISQIIDKLDTNIYIKSLDFKYAFANKSMTKLSGLESMIDKTDAELPWKDQAEILNLGDRNVFETGKDFNNIEGGVIENKDNRFFISSKKPLYDDQNRIIGLIGTAMDITDIKVAQIKTEQEKQSKQFFISAMSHEMNNYVQSIRNASKFLAENSKDKTTKELSEIINYASYKLMGLRENLYDFSKVLHSGEVLLKKEKVDVKDLIRKEIQVYNGMGAESLNGNKIISSNSETTNYI